MDKLLNNSEFSETKEPVTVSSRGSDDEPPLSPIFRTCTVKNLQSDENSDDEIPSYQINQSSQTTSNVTVNDDSFILPSCLLSPSQQVHSLKRLPSVPKISSILKRGDEPFGNQSKVSELKTQSLNVYDSLGMVDKDISWASCMASPTPLHGAPNEYNTIEKATFLPEEDFKNIQPRALFSPSIVDEFGFKPLNFSSDSEDGGNSYTTKMRLSDVCDVLRDLHMKTLEMNENADLTNGPKTSSPKQCERSKSPVITIAPKRRNKKKQKRTLVLSPVPNSVKVASDILPIGNKEPEVSMKEDFSLQDDSFQNISFSVIDELCKSSVDESVMKSQSCDKLVIKLKPSDEVVKLQKNGKKICYGNDGTIHPTISLDNALTSAKLLEEADVEVGKHMVMDQLFHNEKGLVPFDQWSDREINQENKKRERSEPENSKETKKPRLTPDESFFVKLSTDKLDIKLQSSHWDCKFDSQTDVSDTQIFQTVEDMEKMMGSEIDKQFIQKFNTNSNPLDSLLSHSNVIFNVQNPPNHDSAFSSGDMISEVNKSRQEVSLTLGTLQLQKGLKCTNHPTVSCINLEGKLQASASSLSNDYTEGRLDEENNKCASNLSQEKESKLFVKESGELKMAGFSTASGKSVNVSEKALEKAKIILEVSEPNDSANNAELSANNQVGFSTASGKRVAVSNACIEAAKRRLEWTDDVELSVDLSDRPIQNIEAAADIVTQGSGSVNYEIKEFSTASGKSVPVSKKSLLKAKLLLDEAEHTCSGDKQKETPKDLTAKRETSAINVDFDSNSERSNNFLPDCKTDYLDADNMIKSDFAFNKTHDFSFGFSTASGKQVKVSKDSLKKVKKILEAEGDKSVSVQINDFLETTEKPERPGASSCSFGFSTASGKKVGVSKDLLMKAKALLETEKLEQAEADTRDSSSNSFAFSTASGKQVGVSKASLVKAKAFLERESAKTTGNETVNHFGFSTASGKQVEVKPESMADAKLLWKEQEKITTEGYGRNVQIETHNPNSEQVKSAVTKTKTQLDTKSDLIKEEAEAHLSSETSAALLNDSEWEDVIPQWLHCYQTSPSIISDRSDLSGVVSHEERQCSTQQYDRYINRSPILGANDRFSGKRKPCRKLEWGRVEEKIGQKCSVSVPFKNGNMFSKKRDSSDLSVDFSAPFKRIKIEEKYPVERLSEEVIEGRKKAREEQANLTGKVKIKPVKGSHFLKKETQPQQTWQKAVGGAFPEMLSPEALKRLGISDSVMAVNIDNALDFRFSAINYFDSNTCFTNIDGIPLDDDSRLILDDENSAGMEEFARAFLASPGVEPSLISKEWVANHYRWIVWKLAHYEKSFPRQFANRCLTPHNVMLQLKYRYDREIDQSQRSALKRILERDDSSAKRLVLCVYSIKKVTRTENVADGDGSFTGYELGLTDGWYGCPARTDAAMTRFINSGKVAVGTKLVMYGSELVNCDQGVSPLELPLGVHLKVFTNSTRRIRWDAKLGFQKNLGSFPVSLNSILPHGGNVGRVDVIIARIYPMSYMERTKDGKNVVRNSRAENKMAALFQKQQEARIEQLYIEIQAEFQNSNNNTCKKSDKKLKSTLLREVTSGEDLCHLMEDCSDPSSFEILLSSQQKRSLTDFQQRLNQLRSTELSEKLQARLKEEKMNQRNVSELVRMKVVDFRASDSNKPALFTMWKPTEDVITLFSEGHAISLLNVSVGNSKFFQLVQLNSTRQTRYKKLSFSSTTLVRSLTSFIELKADFQPEFNEIDAVGIVVSIQQVSYDSGILQTVYLADSDYCFLGIVLWKGSKEFAWDDVLTVSSIVAATNLQWKKNSGKQNIPCVYVNETTSFTQNPKLTHLNSGMENLKSSLPKKLEEFISKCQEELRMKLEEAKTLPSFSKNASASRDIANNDLGCVNFRCLNGFAAKPNASSTPLKSGLQKLDSNNHDPSPIQRRIDKLQSYGEPPPLSPLLLTNNVEKLKNKFRVPIKSSSDSKNSSPVKS